MDWDSEERPRRSDASSPSAVAGERRSAARSRENQKPTPARREREAGGWREKRKRESFYFVGGVFSSWEEGLYVPCWRCPRYAYAEYVLLSWPRPASGTRVQCQRRGLLGSPPCDLTSSVTAPAGAGLPAVYVRVGPTCKRARGNRWRDQNTVLPLGPTDCACQY